MSNAGRKQVLGGATFSYILIILNTIYGLVLTPYIISLIGETEYGVYKTIASLSSTLMVLDLGLGGTVTRYIAKYRSRNEEKEISNFMAIIIIEAAIIIAGISLICLGLYSQMGRIYAGTFDEYQLSLAHKLFILTSINVCFTVLENITSGVITGCNELIFGNGIKIIRLLLRILLIFVIFKFLPSALSLVSINLCLSVTFLAIEVLYIRYKLGIRSKYKKWDTQLFSESFKYTLLIFISSIINQVNGNLDNVVVGAVIGASAVAVYSIGLTLYGMFEQLSTAISGIMLPTVMNTLAEENGMIKVRSVVVRAGRVQFALLGAALCGFAVLGKDFIMLWLGSSFMDAYAITIILMIPSIFSLTVNVCISILRAKNMLGVRTFIIFGTTVLNALITCLGTPKFGYYAAAIGTSFSLLVGIDIITNIYYTKKFGFNMLGVYKDIFSGLSVALLIPSILIYFLHKVLNSTWVSFGINVIVFIAIYLICLVAFGLNVSEKAYLKKVSGLLHRF